VTRASFGRRRGQSRALLRLALTEAIASGMTQKAAAASPSTTRNEPGATRAVAEEAVPVRRWWRVQWQYPAASRGASISNRTPPHPQCPVSAGDEVIASP